MVNSNDQLISETMGKKRPRSITNVSEKDREDTHWRRRRRDKTKCDSEAEGEDRKNNTTCSNYDNESKDENIIVHPSATSFLKRKHSNTITNNNHGGASVFATIEHENPIKVIKTVHFSSEQDDSQSIDNNRRNQENQTVQNFKKMNSLSHQTTNMASSTQFLSNNEHDNTINKLINTTSCNQVISKSTLHTSNTSTTVLEEESMNMSFSIQSNKSTATSNSFSLDSEHDINKIQSIREQTKISSQSSFSTTTIIPTAKNDDTKVFVSDSNGKNKLMEKKSEPLSTSSSFKRRNNNVKEIMSILAIMFLSNIAFTYTLLLTIFTTTTTTISTTIPTKSSTLWIVLVSLISFNIVMSHTLSTFNTKPNTSSSPLKRHHPHVIPPKYLMDRNIPNDDLDKYISNVTLRQFLSDQKGFHLGLGPAFFGFYVYFGILTAFQESVLSNEEKDTGSVLLPVAGSNSRRGSSSTRNIDLQGKESSKYDEGKDDTKSYLLKSVAGASAGAMAAVLLASGLNPRDSADFVSKKKLKDFFDPFGLGGVLKGDMFENIMINHLKETKKENNQSTIDYSIIENLQLENGLVPVAVTVFDLLSLTTKTLTKGCMGKAARASACFPILFQPVSWKDDCDDGFGIGDNSNNDDIKDGIFTKIRQWLLPKYLFIDGGVEDPHGLLGLASLRPEETCKRVVNLAAGEFARTGPPGPSKMPSGLNVSEVLSISVENAPSCGPDKMSNGPRAVKAALLAVEAVLDVPMYFGEEKNHFILNIDATAFIPPEAN